MIENGVLRVLHPLLPTYTIVLWSTIISLLLGISAFRGEQTIQTRLGILTISNERCPRLLHIAQHRRLITDILSKIGGGSGPDLYYTYISAIVFSSRTTKAVFFLSDYGSRASSSLPSSSNALVKGIRVKA